MILVTLGTQDKSFVRLLEALEEQLEKGLIQDKVIVQSGYTQFKSKYMQVVPYWAQEELDQMRQNADVIISHGGVGSILDCLKYGKKVIGAARLKEYGEHINDHQTEILEKFSDDDYILYARDLGRIHQMIEEAKYFTPKAYPFDNKGLILRIKALIDEA